MAMARRENQFLFMKSSPLNFCIYEHHREANAVVLFVVNWLWAAALN
jgi:hypothetical protein